MQTYYSQSGWRGRRAPSVSLRTLGYLQRQDPLFLDLSRIKNDLFNNAPKMGGEGIYTPKSDLFSSALTSFFPCFTVNKYFIEPLEEKVMKVKQIAAVVISTALVSPAIYAATNQTTTNVSPAEQQRIEKVVHNYLVKNPEVVIESLQVFQQKQMDQARKSVEKTQEAAPQFADRLFKQTTDPVIGNPNGAVTIVEFFDYQCPHCVEMTPIIEGLIKANPNLRIVLKEFPIRGPISEFASKAALAAQMQGKYFEFHKGIMNSKEKLTEDNILKIAQAAGLDVNKLKEDMKSNAVEQIIKTNYKLAQQLGLMGTPAFFIAKSTVTNKAAPTAVAFIPGQVDQAQLQAAIETIGK